MATANILLLSLLCHLCCSAGAESALCSENGDVRLVDGPTPTDGKVEICINMHWSSVCNTYGWGQDEISVLCIEQGYQYGRNNHTGYGRSSGLIYSMSCSGDEIRLVDCSHTLLSLCSKVAGVICYNNSECNESDVRLVDGLNNNTGRVEICYSGAWGSVCSNYWGINDAIVVCRQLGYNGPSIALRRQPVLSNESLFYHLDNVYCTGEENRLIDCRHNGIGIHNCEVRQDEAGVNCSNIVRNCNETEVRLVNGTTTADGRVEMCADGQWKPVCNPGWDICDTTVVCRQFGYNRSSIPERVDATLPHESFIYNMHCTGTETMLSECNYNNDHYTCYGGGLASVFCNIKEECNETDVRLVNGTSRYNGEVEICYKGFWRTVCSYGWSTADAKVVCRQLGYEGVSNSIVGRYIASNFSFETFYCTGNESSLVKCQHSKYFSTQRCSRAKVLCIDRKCKEGDIRLAGGKAHQGKLEVCAMGEWSHVCDQGWDKMNAKIACRQLGYNGVSYPLLRQNRQNGKYYILKNINCHGEERVLTECPNSGLYFHQCGTGSAGVVCTNTTCETGSVHLVGGYRQSRGRVEYCYNGTWHSICADGLKSINGSEAKAVCQSLGYDTSMYGSAVVDHGHGTTSTLLYLNISCTTNNKLLTQCSISELVGQCHKTAGVNCIAPCVSNGLTNCSRCTTPFWYRRHSTYYCRCGISCLKYGDCCSDYSVVEKCDRMV